MQISLSWSKNFLEFFFQIDLIIFISIIQSNSDKQVKMISVNKFILNYSTCMLQKFSIPFLNFFRKEDL